MNRFQFTFMNVSGKFTKSGFCYLHCEMLVSSQLEKTWVTFMLNSLVAVIVKERIKFRVML